MRRCADWPAARGSAEPVHERAALRQNVERRIRVRRAPLYAKPRRGVRSRTARVPTASSHLTPGSWFRIIEPMPKRYTISDGKLVLTLEEATEGGFVVSSPLYPGLWTQAESVSEAF